jgi:hypothetical protein
MMTRRPLFALTVLLTLTASVSAGEPIETGRPYEAVGTVTSRVGRSDLTRGTSYTLRVRGAPIGLLPGEVSQAEALDRLVASHARARFAGVLYRVGGGRFLFLESIKENQ